MSIQSRSEELARLLVLLDKLKTGTSSHFDELEKDQLTRETTAENVERIRSRIAELELKGNDNPEMPALGRKPTPRECTIWVESYP